MLKEVKDEHEEGVCSYKCVDMHKFCSKKCCIVRCFVIVIVLFGTFALGCAFGSHRGDRFDSRENYRSGRHMMQFDTESYRGGQHMMYEGYGSARGMQTGYRMMGQPTSIQIQAVPATQAEPQVQTVTTATSPKPASVPL